MIDFVFNIRSELQTWEIFEPDNLIQKRQPAYMSVSIHIFDNISRKKPLCYVSAKRISILVWNS